MIEKIILHFMPKFSLYRQTIFTAMVFTFSLNNVYFYLIGKDKTLLLFAELQP